MKEEWFEKRRIILLPIALFVIFGAAYYITQTYFIECTGKPGHVRAGCEEVNVEYIFKPTDAKLTATPSALGEDIDVNHTASRAKNAERFGGRYTWVFSFVANTLVGFAAICIFLGVITQWSNTINTDTNAGANSGLKGILTFLYGIPWTYGGIIAAIILMALPLYFPDSYMPTTRVVLEKTIQSKGFGIAGINGLIDFLNGLTGAATILFVFGLCALAFPRSKERVFADIEKSKNNVNSAKRVEMAVQKLVEKKKDLRLMLFVAAFLLVICIVRLNSTQTWTLTFMEDGAIPPMKAFYKDFSTVLGGFFTLLLGATYIPAAFIINKRGEILSRGVFTAPAPAGAGAGAVIKPEFKFSIYDTLPKILAIAAPFLATPLTSLLGGF